MMMIISAKMASDQTGYEEIVSNTATALIDATAMPNHRPNSPPDQSENAATHSQMPTMSESHPHRRKSPRMYTVVAVKNVEFVIAAMPYVMLSTPAISSSTPANTHQPLSLVVPRIEESFLNGGGCQTCAAAVGFGVGFPSASREVSVNDAIDGCEWSAGRWADSRHVVTVQTHVLSGGGVCPAA